MHGINRKSDSVTLAFVGKKDVLGLSSELGARQAQREVVKIKFFDFAYWA